MVSKMTKKKLMRINRHLTLELQNATREIKDKKSEVVLKGNQLAEANIQLRSKIELLDQTRLELNEAKIQLHSEIELLVQTRLELNEAKIQLHSKIELLDQTRLELNEATNKVNELDLTKLELDGLKAEYTMTQIQLSSKTEQLGQMHLELQQATNKIERVESVLNPLLIEETNLLRMKIGLPSLTTLPSSNDLEDMIQSTKNLTDTAPVKAILCAVGVACCGIGPYLLFDSGYSCKPATSNPVLREDPSHWCVGGVINILVASLSLLLSKYFSSGSNAVYGYVLVNTAVFALLMLGQPSTDFGILQLCGNLPFLVLIASNSNHFYDGYPVLMILNLIFYMCQVYFVRFFNSRFGFRVLSDRVVKLEASSYTEQEM